MPVTDTTIEIREAKPDDFLFVTNLMTAALSPYYGRDHRAHAERIFAAHIAGGKDQIGHFSFEQRMFIATVGDERVGMLHLVGKRQGNYKISPIIVSPEYRGRKGIGSRFLAFAESYARSHGARQIYCTVAHENNSALQFFLRNGYTVAGQSDSHYKEGITEVMLYKLFTTREFDERFDRPHISVVPCEEKHEEQVRALLFEHLPRYFFGIDEAWMNALFQGYHRRGSRDVNKKYKLIYIAIDRSDNVLGVAGATPKKGEPIKLMPFVALCLPAFVALLTDVPYQLKIYGHKLYIHITPSVEETVALQGGGWRLDAAMPAAYHDKNVTQQWSLHVGGQNFMRMMRVKQQFLDDIRKGVKTLEVRVGYHAIQTIQEGERINMTSRADGQIIRVKSVRRYASHNEMLAAEDFRKIAPRLGSKEEVLELLKEIYPPVKEKLGVYVLEIEPLK